MRATSRLAACLCASISLVVAPIAAQTSGAVAPTAVEVMVLPAAGDPQTVKPLASRVTAIAASATVCNQPKQGGATGAVVNPRTVIFDDPFNAGRDCVVPLPTGLTAGTGYRTATKFTAPGTCVDPASGATVSPCESVRSLVAGATVTIQDVTIRMSAPGNVRIVQ